MMMMMMMIVMISSQTNNVNIVTVKVTAHKAIYTSLQGLVCVLRVFVFVSFFVSFFVSTSLLLFLLIAHAFLQMIRNVMDFLDLHQMRVF